MIDHEGIIPGQHEARIIRPSSLAGLSSWMNAITTLEVAA